MKTRVSSLVVASAVLLAAVLFVSPCSAGELETKARAVAEKYQKAVVTVQLVVKVKFSAPGMGSQENESRSEISGCVLDPAGLTVASLSAADPQGFMESLMQEGDEQFKSESSIGDIKLLLEDNTEIPAQIVLRDKDLDLVFMRPIDKPAQPLVYVDLAQAGEAQILDQAVSLGRLGKVGNRAATIGLERIHAVVKRPRLFYVPGNDPTHSALGCPVFDLEGKVLGIFALRVIKGSGNDFGSMFGGDQNMLPTIVTAADVLEVAKQAATAAPEPVAAPKPEQAPPAANAPAATPAAPPAQTVVIPAK